MDINLIHHGDNLEVLSGFQENFVDLCYIDPPFLTGIIQKRENGISFDDRYRSMDEYIGFMRPRIENICRVLKENGSFYLHCDYHANIYLRILCDEIFGVEPRREIVFNTGSNISGFKSKARNWIRQHDTIYFYTRSNHFTFNKQFTPWSEDQLGEFNKTDEEGRIYKTYMKRGKEHRQYLDENPGIPIGDVWNDIMTMQYSALARDEGVGYPTQKPLGLLERIIKASSNPGDVVLDAFCGSGTTLVAAKMLDRKYVGIDANQDAVDITRRRIDSAVLADTDKDCMKRMRDDRLNVTTL